MDLFSQMLPGRLFHKVSLIAALSFELNWGIKEKIGSRPEGARRLVFRLI
jgi:hypothetical protein